MARLDRLLANLGYGSRREVQGLVRKGAVVFDGAAVSDGGLKVPVVADLPTRLTIAGAPVDPPAPLTLLMHKPLGVVCSHQERSDVVPNPSRSTLSTQLFCRTVWAISTWSVSTSKQKLPT